MMDEDAPLESDVPSLFEQEAGPNRLLDEVESENFALGSFSEADDITRRRSTEEEPVAMLDSDEEIAFFEAAAGTSQAADPFSAREIDDVLGVRDVPSDRVIEAGFRRQDFGIAGEFVGQREGAGERDSDNGRGAASDSSLPSWLLEDRDGAVSVIDFLSSREVDDLEPESPDESAVADDVSTADEITLALPLVSNQRSEVPKVAAPALADAGSAFEAVLAQPWQAMPVDARPDRVKSDSGTKAKSARRIVVPLLYAAVILVLLLVAVLSYLYLARPDTMQSLDEITPGIQQTVVEAITDGISRFIK